MTPHVADIQAAVCERFHLLPIDMISQRRNAVRPRQIAMFLSRELTVASLPTIGRLFSRDHTTVLHACKIVAELIANNPRFAADIAELRGQLSQPAC